MKNVKHSIFDKSYNVVDSIVKKNSRVRSVEIVKAMEATIPSSRREVEDKILEHIHGHEGYPHISHPPTDITSEQLDGAYDKFS